MPEPVAPRPERRRLIAILLFLCACMVLWRLPHVHVSLDLNARPPLGRFLVVDVAIGAIQLAIVR